MKEEPSGEQPISQPESEPRVEPEEDDLEAQMAAFTDSNSPGVQAIKDAIRKIVEMDEKFYKSGKLFSPAVKELLEK